MNGLYIIITNPIVGYTELTETAVSCGVSIIQLRIKNADIDKLGIAKKIKNITNKSNTLFIVNDDIHLAIKSDADGVHLGQNDLPILEAVRFWNNPNKIIGISTHNKQQAIDAEKNGADYIGIGPVYSTRSKFDLDPILGIDEAQKINSLYSGPTFAIGGIDKTNLKYVKKINTNGFCVLSAVNNTKNPEKIIKELQENWKA